MFACSLARICMLISVHAWKCAFCVCLSACRDNGTAAAGVQPADIQTGFLTPRPGCSPSQRFVGGPGESEGTPFDWFNIPVCSSPGDETFVPLRGGQRTHESQEGVNKKRKWEAICSEAVIQSIQVCHCLFFCFYLITCNKILFTSPRQLVLLVWVLICFATDLKLRRIPAEHLITVGHRMYPKIDLKERARKPTFFLCSHSLLSSLVLICCLF